MLGSYPQKSRLVGPVADASEELKHLHVADMDELSLRTLPSEEEDVQPLKIGIIGYGAFGQFLSKRLSMKHRVSCMDPLDKVRHPTDYMCASRWYLRLVLLEQSLKVKEQIC